MKALIEFIIKRSWLVITVFTLLTLLILSGATRIKLSSDAGVFQPDHHPLIDINNEIKGTFGTSKSVIAVLSAEAGGSIYTAKTLNQLRALTAKLEAVDGVERVTSLTSFGRLVEKDGAIESVDLVGKDNLSPAEISAVRQYIARENSSLVSADGKYAVAVVQMESGQDQQKFGDAVANTVRQNWKGEINLAGEPFIIAEVNRTIVNDLQVIGLIALGMILFFLFLNFGSIHGVLLPLVQVFFGMNLGLGMYGFTGAPAGQLTTIGIIAILAVGSSFALHLLGRFYSELSQGMSKQEALRATYTQTAQGVLISGLAIVVAMATLWLSDIGQLRDVGTLIVSGVVSTLASSLILMPALINLLPAPKVRVNPEGSRNSFVGRLMVGLADFVYDHKRTMFLVAGVLVVFGLLGASRIQANTSFLSFFPKNSPTVASIQKVDEVFGGSGSVSLMLEGDVLDPKVLQAIDTFKMRAKNEIKGVGTPVSITDTVKTLNELFTGEHKIPSTREQVSQALLIYQSSVDTAELTRQLSLNQRQTLVSVPMPLRNTQETRGYYNQIANLSTEVFAGIASVKVGGDSLSGLALEDAMIHDFILSLSLAIVLVVIVDSLVRSFRAAIITISSLVMTIVLQYGLLGWLGIDLDISTMMLGALAIGVGDYAIHLTVRFLEELRKGFSPKLALENTLVTSGRSILYTALTLGAGFAALSFSQLQPVANLGQLMVFTVLAVGVSSLTLLPAMSLQFLSGVNQHKQERLGTKPA